MTLHQSRKVCSRPHDGINGAEAVRGDGMKSNEIDMIHGSIWDKIPRFALPVAATSILEQLFNAADVAVVGNFTGDKATIGIAAVGSNSPIVGLLLNLFIGISLGANVVIATALGRKDRKSVHDAVHTAVLMAVIGGILVTILGELAARPLLGMLNVPPDVLPYAVLYLRIYLAGMPVILLYNFEAAIFRSIGMTKMPLIALMMAGVLNVLGNLFFVIVLHMTVDGVATATVLSNCISSAVLFVMLLRTDSEVKVRVKDLKIDRRSMDRILKIGLPAGVQSAVFAVANILIQSAINSLGTVVMAASSAAFNIEVICYNVLNSFSQACTTFVGQNYGAGKIDRCKKTLLLCILEDAIASGLAIGLVLLFGHQLLRLFNSDPEVINTGYTRLVLIFSAYTFSMLYENMSGYLRGFGLSLVPAILTTIGVCGTRFFWIFVIFPASRTFSTIMKAYPVSLSLTALLIFISMMVYRPSKRFVPHGAQK